MRKRRNDDYDDHRHLTPREVERLTCNLQRNNLARKVTGHFRNEPARKFSRSRYPLMRDLCIEAPAKGPVGFIGPEQ
jgi:hypothetical protein